MAVLPASTAYATDTVRLAGRLGLAFEDFQYKEKNDQGGIIDREDAYLPRLSLTLRADSARWFFSGSVNYMKGDADYLAYASSPEGLRSTTSEEMVELALRIGTLHQLSDTVSLEYSGTLGLRFWQRDIHSLPTVSGLNESYRWPYFGLGIKPAVQLSPSQSLSLSLFAGYTYASSLEVEFKDNVYDPAELSLDNGFLLRIEAAWAHAFDETFSVELGPYLELWRFDRSNTATLKRDGSPVGTLFEPANTTRSAGARLCIIKSF
jgi:hypothetical protein